MHLAELELRAREVGEIERLFWFILIKIYDITCDAKKTDSPEPYAQDDKARNFQEFIQKKGVDVPFTGFRAKKFPPEIVKIWHVHQSASATLTTLTRSSN